MYSMKFNNVYVKNSAESTTDEGLKDVFTEHGAKSKCFEFVNFEKTEDADETVKTLDGKEIEAQKVIKNITTTKMASALETAINRGRLNMKQIRELKEASIDFNSMISEKLRENLHKKTVDEIFSSGTGEFDEEEVYEKIPIDLNINAEKAKGVVHELARSRLSNSLIHAVALLRQRNQQGVV
ncbi:hypothetical protein SADUNF_Sadunf19G0115500 [Salix dunnii]|uniref:RRM domain-containing protein n=1 Tax=Salix dunnii TaxID=1413687 RepID=A0A835J2Z7_9ROSI|nr:hypothetical protein SADUNF_Sadunf19G0115500 [Salix dunnii]